LKKLSGQRTSMLLLMALLLPLFFINVKDSHDWGDDFAQYFIQARNILEHRPQTDNGLVFDSQTGEYALQAYPVGFPLILAASWHCFGNSILTSSLTLSLFFFAFGLVSFIYFRKYFGDAISILLTLVIIYNPFTIGFKKEILSDVPFTFFLLLGVLLFRPEKKISWLDVITGIAWGFALSVRGIGATLFLATGFYLLRRIFMREKKEALLFLLKKISVVLFSAFAFYFLLNSVLFPVPSAGILRFYNNAIRGEDFGRWILLNLNYYYEVFLNFFATMGGSYQWLSTITKFILLILIPVGIFISWFRKTAFDDFVFMSYLFVLFIYPYLGGGFRFLLPVLPVLLKYIFQGFIFLMERLKIKPQLPVVTFLLIIILQYTPGIIDQVKSMNVPEQGPQETPSIEAFVYISKLPEDAVVIFLKPRALSFYSGRRAGYVTRNIQPADLKNLFARLHAHYFLICRENDEVNDVLLNNFIAENKNDLKLVWQNSFFDLYSDLK
jgi:hypothetical protein